MCRGIGVRRDVSQAAIVIAALALLLTACVGSADDPTATVAAEVEPSTPTAEAAPPTPTPEPEPTATPTIAPTETPEPTATPTAFVPAPTVAAPIYRPPTQIPPPPPEPTPEVEAPDDSGDIGDLLLSSDLTDRGEGDLEFGRGFVGDGAYHIYNASSEGIEIYNRYEGLDFGNVLVSIDVRMVSDSLNAFGCLMSRADPLEWNFGYSLCINGYSETFAEFEYVDADGVRQFERLVEFDIREETLPAWEWNTLSIISIGGDFGFFVNDEMIGVATHDGPPSGSVAFFVYNYDAEPTEWQFTNLVVWGVE